MVSDQEVGRLGAVTSDALEIRLAPGLSLCRELLEDFGPVVAMVEVVKSDPQGQSILASQYQRHGLGWNVWPAGHGDKRVEMRDVERDDMR